MNKIRLLIFFLGFGLVIAFTVQNGDYTGSFVMLTFAALAMLIVRFPYSHIGKKMEAMLSYPTREGSGVIHHSGKAHVYYGDELGLSDKTVVTALTHHFPFYNTLSPGDQKKFLDRLFDFMDDKVFKIYDKQPFREMPILISASAIQLTFGLKEYLLSHFDHIHVYPDAFMRTIPSVCLLEGNVSGHTINISWKHFLNGYENPTDGENVALHEMAHALYYQVFVAEDSRDKGFREFYNNFINPGNKAFDQEKNIPGGLYSDHAVKNFQEFWAESAELFFEKPGQLNIFYPQLFESLKLVLNQDPLATISAGC